MTKRSKLGQKGKSPLLSQILVHHLQLYTMVGEFAYVVRSAHRHGDFKWQLLASFLLSRQNWIRSFVAARAHLLSCYVPSFAGICDLAQVPPWPARAFVHVLEQKVEMHREDTSPGE